MPLINFSGLASGIDSEGLISATSDAARKTRVDPLEKQKTDLEDQNSSLEELKTMLSELQSAIRSMSSIVGGGVSKLASSSDETNVTATASNAASNGSYGVNVTQMAKNETYSFRSTAGTYASATTAIAAGLGGTETVTVTIGSPTVQTVTVNVTSSTTLSDFANSFNSSTNRAVASVVNVGTSGSPDYRVVLTSASEGTAEGALGVTVAANITAQNAFNNNSEDNATDATFTIDGIGGTITRNSNTVTDLIPGVTFQLQSTGTATISIGNDVETTKSVVQEFIDKFNEIVSFVDENNQITRDDETDSVVFATLSSTRVDEGIIESIRIAISGANYTSGSAVRIFPDLGITTQRDGTLGFDTDIFEEALGDEPESVRELLKDWADDVSLTGGTIDSYIRFNGLLDVTINGNTTQIDNFDDRITRAEEQILRQEESMRARFARLESTIGGLQQQQSALSSALAGLGSG